jgi:glycosyltransferase involved in cell wall biosynthesis
LTNQYPAVSHTFIRRELQEIERRGHEVHRFAIRRAAVPPVDPADKLEDSRTFYVLAQGPASLAWAVLGALFRGPLRFLKALKTTVSMGRNSGRGGFRHLVYLAEACLLLSEVRSRRIEHIHIHFGTNSAAVGLLLRKLGGPSYSLTIHGPEEFDAPRGLSLPEKIASASFVAAISSFCAAQICRWIPTGDWHKVHVIRCTVGDAYLSQAKPVDAASNVLVCVSRLSPEKGHRVLLEGFAAAVRSGVDARLEICGDGPLRPELERLIDELKLAGRVTITGWIDEAEVRRRLLAGRALVGSSFAEGLPVVIMEAMALGRPVIATCVAGIPELVEHGRSGWVVTAGRPDQIAQAIRELVSLSPARVEEMAQVGRQAVLERHNTVIEGEKLERLFLSVVGAS